MGEPIPHQLLLEYKLSEEQYKQFLIKHVARGPEKRGPAPHTDHKWCTAPSCPHARISVKTLTRQEAEERMTELQQRIKTPVGPSLMDKIMRADDELTLKDFKQRHRLLYPDCVDSADYYSGKYCLVELEGEAVVAPLDLDEEDDDVWKA